MHQQSPNLNAHDVNHKNYSYVSLCVLQCVRVAASDWPMETHLSLVVWRCATRRPGALSVTTVGPRQMPTLLVCRLVSHDSVSI